MWGGSGVGRHGKPCSQPGLRPPSVLVLVFLLMFLNLIVLGGCKSFLEGGRGEGSGEPGQPGREGDGCLGLRREGRVLVPPPPLISVWPWARTSAGSGSPHRVPSGPSGLPLGVFMGQDGAGPRGPGTGAGAGRAHLSGIENANDARDNRAVLTFVFLADELDVSKFAEVEVALLLQPIHGQLQIQ